MTITNETIDNIRYQAQEAVVDMATAKASMVSAEKVAELTKALENVVNICLDTTR